MPSIKPSHSLRALFTALCLALCIIPSTVRAEEEDTLELFSAWQEETSTASRAPKPLSQTPENVTVITAKDIELINAHTLADVLDTVPGIQLQHNGGPGIIAYTLIESSTAFFTQVFVDGISINNLNNFADVSAVPSQIIERIEIIKGTASSAWGSALGGVINVITKSPEKERTISGSATASIGNRTTADTRAELSGTTGKLGYYFSGGYLGSDGLLPTMQLSSKNAYAKLTYDLPNHGQLWGTFNYSQADAGDLFAPQRDLREDHGANRLFASLGLRYTLAEGLEFEVAAKHAFIADDYSYFFISDGSPRWTPDHYRDKTIGGSTKLLWRKANNLLVTGIDYNRQETRYIENYFAKADRWGAYLNDTLTVGPVSISPGIRLDHTQTNGDQISASLGATWQLTDNTLLRAYTGRGYNVPLLQQTDSPSAKIWTMQVGAESTAIPYLWLKATLFRNMTWGGAGVEQHLAKGSELELRTTPVLNTTLGAGWTYTETTRTSDGTPVRPDRPTQTVKLALRYDDATFRGTLIGSHINWNSPTDYNAKNGLIWDLHLGATLLKRENSSLELFFSGRNLFNGKSYYRDLIPNTGRWFEGGMRVRF